MNDLFMQLLFSRNKNHIISFLDMKFYKIKILPKVFFENCRIRGMKNVGAFRAPPLGSASETHMDIHDKTLQ
jgi:hypothetical protein